LHRVGEEEDEKDDAESSAPAVQAGKTETPGSPELAQRLKGGEGRALAPARVVVDALDREGRPQRIEATGFRARAIQHEIDHLDGILFIDHLSAVKRGLLLAKWKKARRGASGYVKEVTPEPAGEL
jgi:peptide deformylase